MMHIMQQNHKLDDEYIATDVCVPISRLSDCIMETQVDLKNTIYLDIL